MGVLSSPLQIKQIRISVDKSGVIKGIIVTSKPKA